MIVTTRDSKRAQRAQHQAKKFCALATVLAVLFFCNTMIYAQTPPTAFLPLDIKSGGNAAELQTIVDRALQQALGDTSISFLMRSQAEQLVDYSGTWPPPPDKLQKIAEQTGTENLGVGQLTVIGNQLSIDIKLFDLLSPKTPTYYYKTAESVEQLPDMLQALVGEIERYVQREIRIGSITPEGNSRIDSGAILRKIKTKGGDLYDQAQLREDLKAIYRMGYFNDVQIDVSDSPKGKNIVFRVLEKPVIKSVIFKGVEELNEDDVKGAANITPHFILNPTKITEAEEAIRQLYKTKGFYNSQVNAKISYPDDTGAVVEFTIDEGNKIYIKEITVEGNEAFDDDEILDQIETGERWFMSWLTNSGLLDMTKIKQDMQKIVAFYGNNGYLDAKVADPVITQEEEWLYLKFVVEEGTRYRVGRVSFTGDNLGSEDELLQLLSVRNTEYISRQIIRDDILKLTDYFSEGGYAFASIRPRVLKAQDSDRMDIIFDIDKGSLVYIDRITIRGNTRTRDNVIRRELRIAEGGIFDSKALRQSTQALQRLQFFEEVNITPEPSIDPNRMNVIVEVKEKSTGTFSIGAGYSSVDNVIFMGQISENNFLGRGDTLALSANIGGASSLYNLAYTNPHVKDTELSWGMDLFSTEREYDDYTKESQGGGVRIGYPIFGQWRAYGNYSFTNTDLTDVSENASYIIRNSVDLHVTSALKFSLVRDTRNRRYGATEGSRNVVSVKYAGGPLGGDAEFTKVEGSTSWYFPLIFNTTLHLKGAAGQVFENETDKLPVYERFYLGGLSSIRGFEYGKVSPIDPVSGERIGGDKMWYTNSELIFPLLETQGLMGLVFLDFGQVLDDEQNFTEFNDSIKKSTGVGIRWLSPMGPLSLVWGYNLDPLEDEDDSVWDFSVGGTF
ncbi:outer membrane protein assembly factor BamA [Desulforhopalus singaporensis]|uniref:Outer membrane protein assembly factor BamA n=1 Tax=Desulforhopalus singaporensis TaxID=91360 RepID=A0A1H0JVX5_9BACT|nr:outer membrane protein assembly factor BamA [Desulforhopalus singaporensis]SDO47777.1 Beta-barrel assembly machine subunit BamA [Desulforhopalus singaporensis]